MAPSASPNPRVIALSPLPPEKAAYALARYSRSPDSIHQSLAWVRSHDSSKFLESFYFQYGHASIADLGHVTLCLEGISELAATEVEDEPLWDGQARSSRYQDFGRCGAVVPAEFDSAEAERYKEAGGQLLETYREIHQLVLEHLKERLPRPESMKPEAYNRNLAARAFDVARYLLFFGVPTGVGQVTSIRTLEKQIRRMKASEYGEVRALGAEMAQACADVPGCVWQESEPAEPVAPTLARYVDADAHVATARADVEQWARQNLSDLVTASPGGVDLLKPADTLAEIAATLLYPATRLSFRNLYEMVSAWNRARQLEVIEVALGSRGSRDELLRGFRSAPYVFDIVMDIGAYRDLHRHRRCVQLRQAYSDLHGYEVPETIGDAGLADLYRSAMDGALATYRYLPQTGAQYLLPFGMRSRFLFKMDFAEAEYMCRLRSGPKGHFSYRKVAWEMKQKFEELEPDLGRLIQATPPWVEDPLTR